MPLTLSPHFVVMPPTPPALRPHQHIASIYPAIVLLGLLVANLGNIPESYFGNKRNLFNVYFVKLGWFWTTLVYLPYAYFILSDRKLQSFARCVARWLMVTVYWFLLTQWAFGPSIIDRVFVATGGACDTIQQDEDPSTLVVLEQAACRKKGGDWTGGHDVSGHCLLLIHSSLFLLEELSWLWYTPSSSTIIRKNQSYFTVIAGLLSLWAWMLLMTSIYFHGHYELLSGTVFGLFGWILIVSVHGFC